MIRIEEIILQEKENLGIHEYAFIQSDQVIFSDEVRQLCEQNVCRMYGTSWACPPAVGSIEACRAKCAQFENAFIFTTLAKLTPRYFPDMNEWREARIIHEAITEKAASIFRSEFSTILTLSAEGCLICKSCTYPEKACRFPERMFPATEGFGILVVEQAKECGIKYNNGPHTISYFSMIFF
ncbi:DUF2284 domain-containing protein [Sporomusa sp.]|uniref:DUF2284 domain-containing protein n=1 Tax=Sporomusa sp. TaxID=2078658 RepID=UPI002CBD0441|nr:DUF2284 domain-containing protein [Sporomusa sp.]HWR07084.1 DUF2284 domain-containing protein [Sporomusa sp.]